MNTIYNVYKIDYCFCYYFNVAKTLSTTFSLYFRSTVPYTKFLTVAY